MRLTVKYLQEQLDRANEDKNRYYNLWRELEDEKKEKLKRWIFEEQFFNDSMKNECMNLTNIIHALINPEILMEQTKAKFIIN